MKLVVACVAVLFLASVTAKPGSGKRRRVTIADAFEEAGITEYLNITAPENVLGVLLGDIEVEPGMYISPADTAPLDELLTIEYEAAEDDCLWTLVYLDPNYDNVDPERDPDCLRTLLLGLAVNIKGSDWTTGDILAKFIAHCPRPDTGIHYYTFLWMRQKGKIDVSCQPNYEDERIAYDLAEFIETNNLCPPEAGNFFQTSYPNVAESCQEYCEENAMQNTKYKPRRY